ncbi:MAG: hypothetical protein IPL65_19395 [Lewinellaceae bacterium]|nr:hypothetical protein [Lewinellaceae bacterium]
MKIFDRFLLFIFAFSAFANIQKPQCQTNPNSFTFEVCDVKKASKPLNEISAEELTLDYAQRAAGGITKIWKYFVLL